MKLMTKALSKKIPAMRSQEGVPDPMVVAKFFGGGACTWYVIESDGKDEFFGWVSLGMGPGCDELGYFSLSELQGLRFQPFGLGVERDLHWEPRLLSEVKNGTVR